MRNSASNEGKFWMNEVINFNQADLNINGVMVMDAYKTIYIWVGTGAAKRLLTNSRKKVDDYIKSIKDGRNQKDVVPIEINPAEEPMDFKSFFPEWEIEVVDNWFVPDPLTARKLAMQGERKKKNEQMAK